MTLKPLKSVRINKFLSDWHTHSAESLSLIVWAIKYYCVIKLRSLPLFESIVHRLAVVFYLLYLFFSAYYIISAFYKRVKLFVVARDHPRCAGNTPLGDWPI